MTIPAQIEKATDLIKMGCVIAYPTEGVWGLGCDPHNEQATLRLLALKKRPVEKGLIIIASAIEQFDFILYDLAPSYMAKLKQSWPGPFTWLVPHHQRVPYWITGDHTTVALRVSNHPLVRALCELTGPLVSTSANPTGQPSSMTKQMVEKYFDSHLDLIVDGELGGENKPSQIKDLITDTVIR